MTARFRVKELFEIQGRGVVIAGDIAEGAIKVGMMLVVPGDPKEIVVPISGVEFVDHIHEKRADVGLLIAGQSAQTLCDLVLVGETYEVRDVA